jgi:nicotinamidase-related amidase
MPRSPELMCCNDTALLVVDVQEKLIGLVPGHRRIVWNIRRLLNAAHVLGVPVRELADKMGDRPAKVAFSCAACGEIFQRWQESRITRVLIAGIESHVCIQQTVLDLLAAGYRVYVAVDAIGARHAIDHETALRRMEASGAILTTTESAMFEWCQEAGTPQFREISRLVRESPPSEIA